jgi:signal transduction histidine kinase
VLDGDDLDQIIEFDPNHLEQVLDNLLANAIDAAPSGSAIELWVRGGREDTEVHVTDHGPGLAEADRQRAFDRHWGMRDGGTGLGLAIVERLCANNRARVSLEETPGGGIDVRLVVRRASDG